MSNSRTSPSRFRSSASCRAASTLSPRRPLGRRRGGGHRLDRGLRRFRGFALAMAQIASAYPDRGRALSLGLDSRQPLHRLGDGMAQPARPHHRAGRHQHRHRPSSLRAPSARARHDRNRTEQIVIFVGVITGHSGADQPSRHQADGFAHRLLGLHHLWHHRALIVLLPDCAPTHDVSRLWTFTNYSGDAGRRCLAADDSLIYLFLLCLLLPIYTITGYDASAHTSEETLQGRAFGAARHRDVGALVVALRLGHALRHRADAIPDMAEGAKQGWNVFFWARSTRSCRAGWRRFCLPRHLHRPVSVRSGDGDLGVAHDLRLLPRRRPAGLSNGALQGQSRNSARRSRRSGRPRCSSSSSSGGASTVSIAGTISLHHRGELDGDLPVPVVHRADRARLLRHRARPKWAEDGAVGHRHRRLYRLFAVLSILCMVADLRDRHAAAERLGALHHASASSS